MRCGYRLRLDVNATKLDHDGCYLEELHLRSAGNPLRLLFLTRRVLGTDDSLVLGLVVLHTCLTLQI